MKKLYSLALALLVSAGAFAQVDETFVFTNAKGDIVQDGATITVSNYEIDEWTEEQIFPSGLFVKNNTEAGAYASMKIEIVKLDNGKVQHCFPGSCQMYGTTGVTVRTDASPIAAGEAQSLLSEWLPEDKGNCTVKYTIRVMEMKKPIPPTFTEKAVGATVTVNYVFDDNSQEMTAGIASVGVETTHTAYTLSGQKASDSFKGIVIVNGRKELRK